MPLLKPGIREVEGTQGLGLKDGKAGDHLF